MTYCTSELRAIGVAAECIEFRRWRRAHRLTLVDCALLTGVCADSIMNFELGRTRKSRVAERILRLPSEWNESMRPKRVIGKRGGRQHRKLTGTQQT